MAEGAMKAHSLAKSARNHIGVRGPVGRTRQSKQKCWLHRDGHNVLQDICHSLANQSFILS